MVFCGFFVKQKTAYEMRISDLSSDVCSSDLCWRARRARRTRSTASTDWSRCAAASRSRSAARPGGKRPAVGERDFDGRGTWDENTIVIAVEWPPVTSVPAGKPPVPFAHHLLVITAKYPPVLRSEERRAGKECVRRYGTRVLRYS